MTELLDELLDNPAAILPLAVIGLAVVTVILARLI